MSGPRALVAGCGYLGAAVARLLAAGCLEGTRCTHSAESAAALAGEPFRIVTGDFTDAAQAATWGPFEIVVHSASSRRGGAEQYQQIYVDGSRALLQAFTPSYFLFVSSTSVYAQT